MSDQPLFVAVCPFCGAVHNIVWIRHAEGFSEIDGQTIYGEPEANVNPTCLDRYSQQYCIPLDKWNTRVKPD